MNTTTEKNLQKLAKQLAKRREAEQEAWTELTDAMKAAYADTNPENKATLAEIGRVVGVTKARVYQIVTGKRSGSTPKAIESADVAVSADA